MLINGLGLGMVLHAILQKDDVTHVTVIEKNRMLLTSLQPRLQPIFALKLLMLMQWSIVHQLALRTTLAGMTYGQTSQQLISHRWISWVSTGTSVTGRDRGAGRCEQKLIEFQNLEAD